jgi:hypothetical protein
MLIETQRCHFKAQFISTIYIFVWIHTAVQIFQELTQIALLVRGKITQSNFNSDCHQQSLNSTRALTLAKNKRIN